MEKDDDPVKNYPVPHTPPGWALNDIFLDALQASHQAWLEKGYRWLFSLECSFTLDSHSQFLFPSMDDAQLKRSLRHPRIAVQYDAYQTMAKRAPTRLFEKTIDKIISQADRIAACNGLSVDEVLNDLNSFRHDLKNGSKSKKERARRNIYLAWLHVTPSNEVGLQDLIEPRFGDYLHGTGWWDADIHAEVRISKESDPLQYIKTYHLIVKNIINSAPRFGLAPGFTHTPHIHFSIWKNGRPLLRPTEATKKFRQDVAMGLSDIADKAPYLFNDPYVPDYSGNGFFEFGTHRIENGFRQLDGRWEWRRRSGEDEIGFLSRDLAALMTGASLAIADDEVRKSFHSFREENKFSYNRKPDAVHVFGDKQNTLTAIIGHSSLTRRNMLKPDWDSLTWALYSLSEETGQHALGDFKSRQFDFEPLFDLNNIEAWNSMLRSVRYQPGKGLITDHLSSELQSLFGAVEVKGVQTFITSNIFNLDYKPFDYLALIQNGKPWIADRIGDWDRIKEHYAEFFRAGIEVQASIYVEKLADKFARAAADIENPDAIILETMMYLRKASVNHAMAAFMAAADRKPSGLPNEGPIDRETLICGKSYLAHLRPHFIKAVEGQIEHLRVQELADNRQISFMEAARSYAEDRWYEGGDTLQEFSDDYFDHYRQMVSENQASWSSLKVSTIAYGLSLTEMMGQKIFDTRLSNEDLIREFQKDSRRWDDYIDTYQNRHEEGMKDFPLWKKYMEDLKAWVQYSLNDSLNILGRLETVKTRPDVAPGPA